jgi:hypothetical protein
MTTTEVKNQVRVGGKFVACWGYDQTQYSVYNVVGVSGKSVLVEGMNSWSGLSESDLAPGSKVKVYKFKGWYELPEYEQAELQTRGFNHNNYDHHYRQEAIDKAETRTIVKMQRIDGESWTYLWTLDNGQTVNSRETYKNNEHIKIVNGLKKCLVQDGYNGTPQIKIDQTIRASYDPNYSENEERYDEQNEYTAYNGR